MLSTRTPTALRAPAAPAELARRHFAARLAVETDCADVAADLAAGDVPYAIVDTRGAESFARGHVPGAVNLPPSAMDAAAIAALPAGPVVVYCWGPGCNGAQRGALALAEHGRPVKEMIGGFGYWVREGLPVEGADAEPLAALAEPALVG